MVAPEFFAARRERARAAVAELGVDGLLVTDLINSRMAVF